MLICVEGCLGVGKTTLVKALSHYLKYHPLFEEYTNNPFLMDFYQDQSYYALHVQTTFMFLQERQMKRATKHLDVGEFVVSDFHPIKSKIFAQIVLSDIDRLFVLELYDRLFGNYSQPDLLIFLTADTETILDRIRNRDDRFTKDISPEYIADVSKRYEKFCASYPSNLLTIDTSNVNYSKSSDDLMRLVNQIKKFVNITPYLQANNQ